MISARTASNCNLEIGDFLTVEINNHSYIYVIGAISKTTGLYYSEMDDIILVVSRDQINEVYRTKNLITSFSFQQTSQLESVMRD